MTFMEMIAEIKTQTPEMPVRFETMNQFNLLLRSFKVMREIAVKHSYDGQEEDSVRTLIDQEFEERMKNLK